MQRPIPAASRIDVQAVAATALLPIVVGLTIGFALPGILPASLEGRTVWGFALYLTQLCYLGVAAAHVGGWIVEDVRARLRGDPTDLVEQLRPPDVMATCAWDAFPNPLDAALLALALATLVNGAL